MFYRSSFLINVKRLNYTGSLFLVEYFSCKQVSFFSQGVTWQWHQVDWCQGLLQDTRVTASVSFFLILITRFEKGRRIQKEMTVLDVTSQLSFPLQSSTSSCSLSVVFLFLSMFVCLLVLWYSVHSSRFRFFCFRKLDSYCMQFTYVFTSLSSPLPSSE